MNIFKRVSLGISIPSGFLRVSRARSTIAVLVILVFAAQDCRPASPSSTSTPAPSIRLSEPLFVTVDHTATATAMPEPLQSATLPLSPSPFPSALPTSDGFDSALIRQGARFSSLDPYAVEEFSTGQYQIDLPNCGDSYLTTLPEESGEIVLTLSYVTPLLPKQIEIYTGGQPEGIQRIELLNSQSGLGKVIYKSGSTIQREPLAEGACKERLILPVSTDFEVDTIFIEFEKLAGAAQVGAVEILGRLEGFVELPVFWRVPLPNTPIDIAATQNGTVYVAVEPNGLYTYDVEGNPLKQFSVPNEAALTNAAVDPFGNLIVTDSTYGWFIVLSPEGEQLAVGGDASYYDVAVSPADGNLYLLRSGVLSVYTTDTAETIRQITLDEVRGYGGLTFDPQGRLYALRDHDWNSTVVELDPFTGEELNAIPLERTQQVEIIARDLAIDASSNFYILFGVNAGQVAVHMLDAHGKFLQRFGTLISEPDAWPEGAFLDPCAITVTPDGRFILIADGYEDQSYLTAFIVEAE